MCLNYFTWSVASACLDCSKNLMWSVMRERMVVAIEETFTNCLGRDIGQAYRMQMQILWLENLSNEVMMAAIQLVIGWKLTIVVRVFLLELCH